ncbi:MAG: hypothetical protein E4H09_04515 [Spirochaetales bacterium]|nr:MAG: hypothetical protein E4H09_04515 [Spirochaetales bacterium]
MTARDATLLACSPDLTLPERANHRGHSITSPEVGGDAPRIPAYSDTGGSVAGYAPFYCEENIYQLVSDRRSDDDWVVMISNPQRTIALAHQRAGRPPDGIVIWDYHVVLVNRPVSPGADGRSGRPGAVLDPDTTLDAPAGSWLSAVDYIAGTFPFPVYPSHPDLLPELSLIPGGMYLDRFSSDRSHMRGQDGEFLRPTPPWPSIWRPELGNTLFALVDGSDPGVSMRLGLVEFVAWLGAGPTE